MMRITSEGDEQAMNYLILRNENFFIYNTFIFVYYILMIYINSLDGYTDFLYYYFIKLFNKLLIVLTTVF